MIDRRSFMAGVATSACAIAAPAIVRAQARDKLSMMTPFGFIPDFIEMMNAVAGGHFAAQGIDAELIGGQGAASPIQQLMAGKTDLIRVAGLDVIRTVANNKAPMISVATLYQASTFHMISLKSKPIEQAEDLKGKTVGIVSVAGTTDVFLDLMLHKVGLKKDDVKREVTGNSPGAIQFVKQGRVDCFIASLQVVAALEKVKEDVLVWSTDRYAPMPGQCYASGITFAEKNPDLMRRAMKAMRASAEEIMTQRLVPLFQRAAKTYDIPGMKDVEGHAEVEKLTTERLWLSEGRDNLLRNVPKLWEAGVTVLRENEIASIADPTTLYTNRFLDPA